jgi:diphthine-ammonia ligase
MVESRTLMARKAAVLWTGGKDCTLALCRAHDAGMRIRCLATFHPANEAAPFKAHPLEDLRNIALDANFEHVLIPVIEPYRESYIDGLIRLRDTLGVDTIVTGDIDLIDGFPNWIDECTQATAMETIRPLWQLPRECILHEIVERGIVARISWINSKDIPLTWLGRCIDDTFIEEIVALAKHVPIDPCGENGEYHTMVESIPVMGQTRSSAERAAVRPARSR